jgi:hypothetical protein
VKKAAQQYTEAAVDRLAKIMLDHEQPVAAQVAAARELLDRGYGRPSQAIDQTIEKRNVREMSDEELYAIIQAGGDGDSEAEEAEGQPH